MNKESILKKLNEIKELVNDDKKFKYKNIVNFNCEYIKKELEAIKNTDVIDNYTGLKNDNANFNEVLECLECLYCEPQDYRSNDRAKDYETIKQSLQKTQEQKTMINFLRKIKPLIDVGTYIDGDNYCIRFYDGWRKKNVVSWVGITEEEFYQFRKMLQELGDEF